MNKTLKQLLCALLAVMVLCAMAACRTGGEETTAPSGSGAVVTLPTGEGVEDWFGPTETEPAATDPIDETTEPQMETTEPEEETTEPDEEPVEDPLDDPIAPVETSPSEPAQKPTDPKVDEEPQTSQPQTGTQEPVVLTYEEYMALSPAEQQAYYESFPSLEDYIAWHNAALAEYEANQDTIIATGPIDIGDYINP